MPLSRRCFLAASAALALVGCADGGAIEFFETSGAVARPGGRGLARPVTISYRLRRPASVTALLRGAAGEWPLRTAVPRGSGEPYELLFDGTVPTGVDRQVLRDGAYDLRLIAIEPDGRRDERNTPLEVANADPTPLEIDGPRLSLNTITPDGDGIDDEVRIELTLSKPATLEIAAESANGNRAAILAPTRHEAGVVVLLWDGSAGGRVFGGRRLPDGDYTITAQARDDAGNLRVRQAPLRIANGGIERLEIADVTIEPAQLRVGEPLRIRIAVVNTGETTLRTMGPAPGTAYRTGESFSTIKDPKTGQPYAPTSGAWRVGIGWQDAPQELPLRWGLLADLGATIPPGGTATIDARVTIEPGADLVAPDAQPKAVRFWAGAIREGVGLATGRVGDRVVTILP